MRGGAGEMRREKSSRRSTSEKKLRELLRTRARERERERISFGGKRAWGLRMKTEKAEGLRLSFRNFVGPERCAAYGRTDGMDFFRFCTNLDAIG